MERNLGGVAIFSGTIDDRGKLRSYGIRSMPRTAEIEVGAVSFVVWAVNSYFLTRLKAGK